ncbi:helix-turn-helix domain-containing protein [Brevundimonas aurantiaca]|uniref:helix-turn-helix domain-containing protein n=1 Tax=Brevundimonas aurantiaca TaxID=74316 RepID=UPI001602092D|nr:XRE family transcriptional regulator [Pseudomonas sp. FW305-3-2-15-E-TSA4]
MQPQRDNDVLSQALKLVRRHRGMTAAAVARAMRMALRTYQRFEAGGRSLNLDYIHRFAVATRSDPQAIIMAVAIGSPDLAWRCADNKLITALTIGGQRFNALLGDDIAGLEARPIILAVCAMYDALLAESDRQQAAARWLENGVTDLAQVRPAPGR